MPDPKVPTRVSLSLPELSAEAERLWRTLPTGAVVWLMGEIGSGKTTFVQAVARAAGAREVRSPTFALVHEYPAPDGTIVHADCYRLRDPEEAMDLDFPGLQRRARVLLVEWPERAGRHAPPAAVRLQFGHTDRPDTRVLERLA